MNELQTTKLTLETFTEYRAGTQAVRRANKPCVTICGGTGCRAGGCLEVGRLFRERLDARKLDDMIDLRITGCHGFCEQGPLVAILPQGTLYVHVTPEDVDEIIETSLENEGVVERLTYVDPVSGKRIHNETAIPFYANQQRFILAHSGLIDPTNINDYIAGGGYSALAACLSEMDPDEIIDCVEKSGLRGRGGGGFPTGRKWRSCRQSQETPKYVLCNGDEGDPGAFMDRSIMEGNPHAVLEGMLIAAYAVGAAHGFIYVRLEYPLAVEHLQIAIDQAQALGLLGHGILGTNFNFDVQISRGAGAFICGESTALMASIEGFSGEPRAKHIHTTEKGLFGKPTNLNNVETYANVPLIIDKGWRWYADIGSDNSKGTKIFSLVGKVRNTGLVEVPMGATLRQIIFDIGGGIVGNGLFKAVQTGGPSGGCLPESHLGICVDFDRLTEAGSMMGSGGMIVMDDRTCMVEVAHYFTDFLRKESCGKCTACREGVFRMYELLDKITRGDATQDDVALLEEVSAYVRDNSICGLGKSAANPTLSTLRHFRDEYDAHVVEHRCPAGVCRALTAFVILESHCKACGKCVTVCPTGAITGARKTPHVIDHAACIACGACRRVCPFEAVAVQAPVWNGK